MKKISTSLVLAAILFHLFLSSGSVQAEFQTPTLKDISGHWAEAQIQKAVSTGFVTGYSDGTFKPEATITGEEFITMMIKALQYPVEAPRLGESWFAPYKQAATSHELYNDDYPSGLDKPIARAEIAATLVRATQNPIFDKMIKEEMQKRFPLQTFANDPARKSIEAGPDFAGDFNLVYDHPEQVVTKLEQALASVKNRIPPQLITDTDECRKDANMCGYLISNEQSYVEDFLKNIKNGLDPIQQLKKDQTSSQNRMIYEAASRGLLTGNGNGMLSLDSKVTRAQAVTFVNRVIAFNAGQQFQTDKHTVAAAEVVWHKSNVMTMVPRYFSAYNYGAFEFDDQGWASTSINGLVSCTTTAFLAVDLDDPDDPNRKWLSDDLRWGQSPVLHSLDGVSGYALLSISELTLEQQSAFYHNSCGISVSNDDWTRIDEPTEQNINAKKPQSLFSLGVLEQREEDRIRIKPKLIDAGTATIQVSGYIVPKDFVSKNQITVYYIPIDNVTGGTPHKLISRSHVNETYK
ncbi:S-layer homology domain-containing protein [Paenibacillus hodogayensis]|uniref:S-layer homology domain-containing protein n=1 Tax=Paenibacillus hodogayensis TaxID=279208 RepID=A0ABV5W503_9BACL